MCRSCPHLPLVLQTYFLPGFLLLDTQNKGVNGIICMLVMKQPNFTVDISAFQLSQRVQIWKNLYKIWWGAWFSIQTTQWVCGMYILPVHPSLFWNNSSKSFSSPLRVFSLFYQLSRLEWLSSLIIMPEWLSSDYVLSLQALKHTVPLQ